MRNLSGKLLLLSLAALPMMGNAADSETAGSVNATSTPFSVSCSNGNFTGEAKGVYYNYGSNKSVYLQEYRITRQNNQSGGNKANVNLVVANFLGSGSKEEKSPDSMKQDGQWHSQSLAIMYAPWSSAQIRVEFIFDRSGSDPRCTGRSNI